MKNTEISMEEAVKIRKRIEELQERQKRYPELKAQLIAQAKAELGEDVFEKFDVDDGTDVFELAEQYFAKKLDVKTPLPFSNEQIQQFITMKKFPMHGTFRMEDSPTKSKKNVHGMLLTGKTSDGQDCIFAFSIVKSLEDSNNYTIKLDMYLPCGLWINLARIDADNISHQNFVDQNGQIVESFEALRELPTPHFHYFTEQAQVLQHDDLACMYAKGLDQYASDSLTQDQMFTQILTDFMGKCGIDTSIVSAKVQGCDYDHSNPLFVCDYSHETAQTTSFGDVVAYYELMQEEEKKQQAEKKQEVSQEEQQDMQK